MCHLGAGYQRGRNRPAGGDGSLYSGHAGHPCGGAEQLCESDYQADTEIRVRAANNRPFLRRRKSAGEREVS